MATLADTTRHLREVLKIGGIGIIILLLVVWAFRFVLFIRDTYFPSEEIPNYRLGNLPPLPFKTPAGQKITYKVNTISGQLPVLPKLAIIYRLQLTETNLLTLREVRERLNSVGFTDGETKLDEILYQWKDRNNSDRVITYNILNGNFDISSNYVRQPEAIEVGLLEPANELVATVTRFLDGISEDTSDIDIPNSEVTFLKINNFTLVPAQSLQESQIARIVLRQKPLHDLPILYKNSNSSDMRFYIGRQQLGTEILGAFYKHRTINPDENGTYPLLTAQEALEKLQTGNALLADYNGNQNINITNVYLAYYLGDEVAEYILPVIVFEGVNFRAYVPAIKN